MREPVYLLPSLLLARAALASEASDGLARTPLRVNGQIGGTFPDGVLRLDVTAENAAKLSFQASGGVSGHWGVGLRGRCHVNWL